MYVIDRMTFFNDNKLNFEFESLNEKKQQFNLYLSRASYTTTQENLISKDDRIRSFREKIVILREENASLKRQLSKLFKKHICSLCEKQYNKFDAFYLYLKFKDQTHQNYAQEFNNRMKRERCEKK